MSINDKNLKLSDLISWYSNILEKHGDMKLAVLRKEYRDEYGWYIEDKYEEVNDYYLGYVKDVYFYEGEYATKPPYEEQRLDKRKLMIIDEI